MMRCDPLPTGQQKRENRAEIGPDWTAERQEKMASTVLSTGLSNGTSAFVFNKGAWGWGIWLKDAGRGLQESP
jgi:hypothetical protein